VLENPEFKKWYEHGELMPAFIVLATGSTYPYPAKSGTDETATALVRYRASHEELVQATRVLIVGAGPTGLELAGEISDRWPEKQITILEPEPEILAGPYKQELREEVRRQLEERGVAFVLGEALTAEPESPPVTKTETNPIANIIGTVSRIEPLHKVPSQLNVLMADGTPITIVITLKAKAANGFIPLTNMWWPHTMNPSAPMAIMA